MEQPGAVTPEQQQILNHLREGIAKLRENQIGRAVMAGDKQIAHFVSVSNDQMPHKQITMVIFADSIMAAIDKSSTVTLESFNKLFELTEDWPVDPNTTAEQFRESLSSITSNDKGLVMSGRTDSKSPEQPQNVMNNWSIIKPEITKMLEKRGNEARERRKLESAKTVAQDLKELFNLPEISAPTVAIQTSQPTT